LWVLAALPPAPKPPPQTLVGKVISSTPQLFKRMAALVAMDQTWGQHPAMEVLMGMVAALEALVDLAVRVRVAAVLVATTETAEKLVTLYKLAAQTQEVEPRAVVFHSTT
jgi:hypothetical protein